MLSPGPNFDLRATLSAEVRAALATIEEIDADAKAVHRCRVRIKRARAVARIGRACAPGLSAVFDDTARAVMHAMAQERELSALAGAAREMAKRTGKKSARALDAVAARLDAARLALPALDQERVRADLRDLLALAQVWPEASRRQIRKGVERVLARARRARQRGCGAAAPGRRHRWRRREKDRLYATLRLGAAWPRARRRRRKTAANLGKLLGKERDALLLIKRVEADPALAGGEKHAQRARAALLKQWRRFARRADALGAKLHAGRA